MRPPIRRPGVTDILLLIGNALFLVGVLTMFGACGPAEDGSYMSCHWAERADAGIALLMLILSGLHFVMTDPRIRTGLDLALIPTAVLAWLIPGHVINICMMETMRCHTVMTPAVTVFSAITAVVALIDIFVQRFRP